MATEKMSTEKVTVEKAVQHVLDKVPESQNWSEFLFWLICTWFNRA